MRKQALTLAIVAACRLGALAAAAAETPAPHWVEPMREVHARFTGTPGTLALFGDSITVSLAFWAPLAGDPKRPPPDMAEALERVKAHQRAECWRQWRGPDFGNNGSMTIRWAHENIGAWINKLNPEVAVILFGTNDLTALDRAEFEQKTREVVRRCLDNGTVVILTTVPPRHGLADKAAAFAAAVRKVTADLNVPLIDYHAEILRRRPHDWDGALPQFKPAAAGESEYDVPTLIARDGVHPSNPQDFQDYSAESLRTNGYALRNCLTLVRYAEVIESVLAPAPAAATRPAAAGDGGQAAARVEFPPAIIIEGNPHERGHEYGKLFRAAIRAFLDEEIYAPFTGQPATKDEMLGYAAACGEVVRGECPMIAEELQGIADGSGLTFDEIVLINLHEELFHRTALPAHGHCTAVAVAPPDTGNEQTYVGQTWDWMESVAGKSRVLEWRRAAGASVLAYGFPGMPMGAGVNSAGIALCWTSAALGEKGESPRVGIPSYALIAHLLAQEDLDGVIREARKDRHAGWFTFVLADASGRLANIEGSPRGVVVEQPAVRLARVGYGSAAMAANGSGSAVELHPRCGHMYELLEASQGKNDLARLQGYFADSAFAINVGEATIDMMVFDTTARTAYLSRGPSYKLSWREFAFGAKEASSENAR